jgi:MFS family permease
MSSTGARRRLSLTSPLWHKPGFLKLWAGQSVSLMGSSVTGLALPLTAIYLLHVNASQIGVLKTLQWVPYILISLFVGAWSDRHKRRPLMIAASLGQAIVLGTIVAFAKLGLLSLDILFGAVLITGSLTVLFDVSYTGYIPELVDKEDLLGANSRLQSSAAVAQVSGPAVGGLLIQLVTAPLALLADAISFIVSVVSLLWIREREPAPTPHPGEAGVISQIKAGLAIVARQPVLRALVVTSACYNLFAQWISVLFLIFAVRTLGMSAGVIGAISSGAAVGGLLGSLAGGTICRKIGVGRAYMVSVAGECLVLLAVPFVPRHQVALAAVVMAVAFAITGAGSAVSSIGSISIRQAMTPPHLIGRMTASNRFVSYGVIAIGALFGGLVGQWLGLRTGLLVGAIGLQVTTIWVAFSPLPRLRDLTPAPAGPQQNEPQPNEPQPDKPQADDQQADDTAPASGRRVG